MDALCYVLPRYDPDTDEHVYHLYAFLAALAERVPLEVVVDGARDVPRIPGARRVVAARGGIARRAAGLLVALAAARRRGCRRFYVHYSLLGGLWAGLLARLTGGRAFFWHCGLVAMFFQPPTRSRAALAAWLFRELPLRLVLRLVHHLVTGTSGMADYYTRTFGLPCERILVVPNEIDVRRFAAASRADVRAALGAGDCEVVLFVHRLSERKGAGLLPQIVAEVTAARPRALFVIAGDGPMRPVVEAALAARGLAERVRFLGAVPNRRVPALYAAADLFIMPSLEEGFPRVLLEAMASGTPFVASAVGGVPEICAPEHAPWLVPPGDVAAFAAAVVAALGDPEARARLAAVGRAHVRRFDLPAVVDLFLGRVLHAPERPAA